MQHILHSVANRMMALLLLSLWLSQGTPVSSQAGGHSFPCAFAYSSLLGNSERFPHSKWPVLT